MKISFTSFVATYSCHLLKMAVSKFQTAIFYSKYISVTTKYAPYLPEQGTLGRLP